MKCSCGSGTNVIDSRDVTVRGAQAVRRRHECGSCGVRFTTYETTDDSTLRYERSKKENAERRRRQRAALPKEVRAAAFKRVYLRSQARKEAALTGQPIEALYRQWGCA